MKKVLILLTFLGYCQFLLAQTPAGNGQPGAEATARLVTAGKGRISGTVTDASNSEPVAYATVALMQPSSKTPVDGAVADENGKFSITKVAEGDYKVVISFIGYEDKVIDNIKVSDNKAEINLGTIKVSPTVQELNEVTVQGQKDLIEEKVDRTVYNAENDATNRGGDATDVLRKVPMLSVDLDGNVSMRGSQNLKVLINNRPSTITAGSVADALKQIPSDMIKSVEVITSPSAKYDAEGSGGIINIITKKNNLQGFSLNVDGSAGTRGSDLRMQGSYNKGKMGFTLGGGGRFGYNIKGEFDNTQQTYSYDESGILTGTFLNTQQASTRNQFLFGRYNFGWDYNINKNNYLNASVQFGARNRNTYQDNLFTQSYQNDAFIGSGLRNVDVSDLSNNVDVNLNYTHNFSKPGQELSILSQYSRNNATNNFINSVLQEDDLSITSRLKNLNESYNQETTVQIDYQTPLAKNQMLELGAKDIIRQVTSNFTYYAADGPTGEYVPLTDTRLTNVFNYDQNVTSGYLSYTLNFLKDYTLKAGSRYEYTTINAKFQQEQDEITIPSYGTLVPSVNISKKLKNGNTLKAAYNRRIQRPSLQFLNPNVQASNPLSETVGNPDLRPEFTNNYEVGYNTYIKKTSLSFSAFMRNTTGSIQANRTPVGDVIRTTYENIGKEDAYGLSVFGNVSLSNKLSFNAGTDMYYAVLNNNVSNAMYKASNEGFVYNIRGMGSYTIGDGWGLQLFGFYRGRQVQLQGFQGGFGIYSLSLRKEFNDKKASIGFGAENFFTTAVKMRSELASPILTQSSVNTMRNMSFKVTFSYRIGKMTMNTRRSKSVTNDDLKGNEGGGNAQESGAQMGGGQPQTPRGTQGQMPAVLPKGTQNTKPNTTPADSTQTENAAPAELSGKWAGKMGMFDATFNLKAAGDQLTGTMSTQMGETPITNGKITGNTFSFTVSVNGNEIPFQGKLEGGQLLIDTEFRGNPVRGNFIKQ
ncbi:TonB-dependent receptor [Rhodocytophaga rosea]|uniref:TonB-dependent receptor n=1 Tax=Rhodocytophaga rosea TaxID=2704465 RepID=A0A6C0GJS1_9BACT|nr:TonB-dependent receptor [Rhodocytophaga rosea]QHT68286.1 TonB-dependent receptor [Rhodocytophaga rosea]